MPLNRRVFYDRIRSQFGGRLTQSQVEGMDRVLNTWEAQYQVRTPIPQLAYIFGTQFWETGRTMQPVHEIGTPAYFTKRYGIEGDNPALARRLGNTSPGDGAKYPGRGDVQLTGKGNYQKATDKLRKLGWAIDLVAQPDLVLDPAISTAIMFEGMEEGWFTGRTLDQTIDPRIDGDERSDFISGRGIINGKDKADTIAGIAANFLDALRAASF